MNSKTPYITLVDLIHQVNKEAGCQFYIMSLARKVNEKHNIIYTCLEFYYNDDSTIDRVYVEVEYLKGNVELQANRFPVELVSTEMQQELIEIVKHLHNI